MFSPSDEEEEHTNGFFFWNNWEPSTTPIKKTNNDSVFVENKYTTMKCWLPPVNFGLIHHRRQGTNQAQETDNKFLGVSAIHKQQVLDWGPRFPYLKSLGSVEENDVIWNIFHVNIFGVFKLWRNEYGSVLVFAEAEFGNGIPDEKAVLVVNNQCILRKLLKVSKEEWSALLEALAGNKIMLSFEALQGKNDKCNNSLQKLWYCLCRRRHYLPSVSIRMKRFGVKKLPQYLKILPKFVAEEIRTYNGGDIERTTGNY